MLRRDFLKSGAVAGSLAATGRVASAALPQADGLLLEAEFFDSPGGWVLDTQFFREHGARYLMAHGLGEPVADATTALNVDEAGTYHVWVRTTDWCPGDWEAPGRFKVNIDGEPLATTFGTEVGWGWQDGGTVDLAAGEATVSVTDLTGFNGRFDAIYFAKDPNFVPPNDLDGLHAFRLKASGRSDEPTSIEKFDLVVVGGGIAGCGAALAADREGLKVALVQNRPVFGGNASQEIRVHTLGIKHHASGILDGIDTKHWRNGSDEAIADDEKRQATLDASGVTQLPLHECVSLEMDGKRIASVDVRQTGTGVVRRLVAANYVDCTGDAWLGHWAGAEWSYGRESKSQYGESWDRHGELWSPETPDDRVMGTSIMWNTAEADRPSRFPAVPWAMPVAKNHKSIDSEWYWEFSSDDTHQIDDGEKIRDHMFRAAFGSFANAKRNPRHARRKIVWLAYVSGKRESRRLVGDYVYTQSDVMRNRDFPDTVVTEKRPIDVHYQRNLKGEPVDFLSEALFRRPPETYYKIPFRSLYSKDVENLMMAGRNFSCSHIGLGGPRVQNTTGQMGVATGAAAALCVKHDTTPRGVYENHLAELRGLLGYRSA